MARAKVKRRKHIFKFGGFGGNQTVNVAVPMSPAKWNVVMPRTEAAVISGKPGIAVACANAQCAMDSMGLFPHPVFLAEFTKTQAYFVDRLDRHGQPTHCYHYAHDDGKWIQKFDKPGGKAKLLKTHEVERDVHLRPPQYRGSQAGSGAPMGKTGEGSRTNIMHRSATKRAIEAGWISVPQK